MKHGLSHGPGTVGLLVAFAALLCACGAAPQIHSQADHHSISLKPGDLENHGLAFITPSTVTGQEEEKQAVAFTFAQVLERRRPQIPCHPLSETLSAINQAGFGEQYRRMYIDYRSTGIFDRKILQKVGELSGARYIAQLKLQGFDQGGLDRLSVLGLRIMMTKYATLRLFFQIWDAGAGTIVWEGIEELNYSVESVDERTVTLQAMIEVAAENLVKRLPGGPP